MKLDLTSVLKFCGVLGFVGSSLLWIASLLFFPLAEGTKIDLAVAGGKEDRAEINRRIDKSNEKLEKVNQKVQEIYIGQRDQSKDIKQILAMIKEARSR